MRNGALAGGLSREASRGAVLQAKPPGAVPGASHPQHHLCRGPSFHQGRIGLTSPPIAMLRMPCRDGHTRGKTWEKCIVWLLLCHTMECEPSHYVVWQKANHRNRHFPMIRENALISALPHQPQNRRKSCGVVHGQPEPDSWNQAAPGANHHGLVVEFVLEELLPLPPLEPFCELDC